jgi:hypothetical protein
MKHRTGLERSQTLLFPEALEDYVAAENPVRFLDAFVGSLDLHAPGSAKARCAHTGSPPCCSKRKNQRNVEVIWLVRKLAPDHSHASAPSPRCDWSCVHSRIPFANHSREKPVHSAG